MRRGLLFTALFPVFAIVAEKKGRGLTVYRKNV
jgi:hypothetical protein